jgi:TetR/AcrR family tetracycline transcriptional repressor
LDSVGQRLRGQAADLDRSAIIVAATQLLTEHTSPGLSMRNLALRLGVTPNALYNHVRDKTELIDALLDDALGEVRPETTQEPRQRLATTMVSSYDVLVSRRDLVPLYLERRGARGANAVALGELMREALSELGLDADKTQRATQVLIVQAIGFAAYGTALPDVAPNRSTYIDSLNWTLDGILPPN